MPATSNACEQIATAAAALTDPAARAAFLDAACAGDAALRAEVEELLRHDAEAGSFLDDGLAPEHTIDDPRAAERPGAQIGPYKLREQIGEGGFGLVFVAEQQEPVRRKVALKVIKPGMDTREVLARFTAERQALALMDHPNIARVFDGGATETGRPYFVMELVRGVSITEFCDTHRLSPRERLALFVTVCQAVQHAHQKGIIHRDIKPTNVLVSSHDGRPVVKVIDFGIAKAVGSRLTERTVYTQFAQMVGTPLYMSPEQAQMSGLDVDTRSDIYSLGVLLYELLTGTTPFDKARLAKAGLDEIRRVIREEEPEKPSTRLSHSGDRLPAVAAQRKTEPARLSRLVRGDLDWITMKCLEKDRIRRYETANELAIDVERYLADEPVSAGPPSASYRVRKFVRRNRAAVMASSVMVALLIGGIVGTTWGLIRAEAARKAEEQRAEDEARQRQRAEAAERVATDNERKADGERKKAVSERNIAQAVRNFLRQDLLRQAHPKLQADAIRRTGGGVVQPNPTVRDLLDRAAASVAPDKIESKFPQMPEVQVEILRIIGDTYTAVGEFPKAVDHLGRAQAIAVTALGPVHQATLNAQVELGAAYQRLARTKDAIRVWEQARDGYLAAVGPDELPTLTALEALAGGYRDDGRHQEAIKLLEQVRQARERKLGPDDPSTLIATGNLGFAHRAAGNLPEAIGLYENVLARQGKTIGPEHPSTLTTMSNLAYTYTVVGRPADAIPVLERLRDVRLRQLAPDHPDTLITLNNLARALAETGRLPEAIPIWVEILPKARKRFEPGHPTVTGIQGNWITALEKAGRLDEAARVARTQVDADRADFAADDPRLARSLAILGQFLLKAGRPADAEPVLRECLAVFRQKEPENSRTFRAAALLGGALLGQKKYAEAETLLLEGYEGMRRTEAQVPKPNPAHMLEIVKILVQLYDATGKPDLAAKWRAKLPNP